MVQWGAHNLWTQRDSDSYPVFDIFYLPHF